MGHENSPEPCHAAPPVVAGKFPSDLSLWHQGSVQDGSRRASGSASMVTHPVAPSNRANLEPICTSAPQFSKPESADLVEEPADEPEVIS